MSCTCFQTVNDHLVRANTELVGVTLPHEPITRAIVATQRINELRDRRLPVEMAANYCPFCGVPYGAPEGETLASEVA